MPSRIKRKKALSPNPPVIKKRRKIGYNGSDCHYCELLANSFPELQGKRIQLPSAGRKIPIHILLACHKEGIYGRWWVPKNNSRPRGSLRTLKRYPEIVKLFQTAKHPLTGNKAPITGTIRIPKISKYVAELLSLFLKENDEESIAWYHNSERATDSLFRIPKHQILINNLKDMIKKMYKPGVTPFELDHAGIADKFGTSVSYITTLVRKLRKETRGSNGK